MRLNIVKLKFYILILLVLISIITSIVLHAEGYNFREIIAKVYNYKFFSIAYISLFLISSFFPLPFLTFIGAAIFPFWEVLLYSLIGNMFAMTITFYLVRWLGRDYVQQFEKKYEKLKQLDLHFEKRGFWDVMLLRFFFIIPPEAVSFFSGLSKMRFKDYFLASLIGTIPLVIASILLVQSRLSHNLLLFIISIILLILMLILPVVLVIKLRDFVKNGYKNTYQKIKRASWK